MSSRRASRHKRCSKCKIHIDECFCSLVSPITLETKLSLIIHKKEKFLTSNTANLALMGLTNAQYAYRGIPDRSIEDQITFSKEHTQLYLYPTEDAVVLDSNFLETLPNLPIELVVPDATWKQAKKFHKREEALKPMMKVKLPPIKGGSIYQLRKQKYDEGLCTYEAIVWALSIIEKKPEIIKQMLPVLEEMNKRTMKMRNLF